MAAMTNHSACPAADRVGNEWKCCGCGETLAVATPARRWEFVFLRMDLISLNKRHDALPTYGLSRRQLTTCKDPRRASAARLAQLARQGEGVDDPEIYVYCPRRGICGRGQHLRFRPV